MNLKYFFQFPEVKLTEFNSIQTHEDCSTFHIVLYQNTSFNFALFYTNKNLLSQHISKIWSIYYV